MHHLRKKLFLFCILLFCFCLEACAPQVNQRGRFLEQESIGQIRPQVHHKEDVQRILGSPTTVGLFGETAWVYTGIETETYSFLKPNVNVFSQVQITFNDDGVVQNVAVWPSGHIPCEIALTPESEKTKILGYKEGFFQQIFGNFGRFSHRNTSQN